MAKPRKKEYHTGDQLHFLISEDFVETANAFFDHCDEEMLNASSVIRRAMTEWLERSMKSKKESDGTGIWTSKVEDIKSEPPQIQGHPNWATE